MKYQFIKVLRVPEVLLMSGFFIIGSFFGITDYADGEVFKKVAVVAVVTFFTILAIYAFNAWAGQREDKTNSRLKELVALKSSRYLLFGFVFLIVALVVSLLINNMVYTLMTIVIFFIWMLYSYPSKGMKYKPYWGTILHFIAQIIHFNLCYYIVRPLDFFAFFISVYFAIAFSVGHLNHELIDFEADKETEINNTVSKRGISFVLKLIWALCGFNTVYILILYLLKAINLYYFFVFCVPALGHLILFLIYYKNIKEKAAQVRTIYRALYFFCFIVFVSIRIWQDMIS